MFLRRACRTARTWMIENLKLVHPEVVLYGDSANGVSSVMAAYTRGGGGRDLSSIGTGWRVADKTLNGVSWRRATAVFEVMPGMTADPHLHRPPARQGRLVSTDYWAVIVELGGNYGASKSIGFYWSATPIRRRPRLVLQLWSWWGPAEPSQWWRQGDGRWRYGASSHPDQLATGGPTTACSRRRPARS